MEPLLPEADAVEVVLPTAGDAASGSVGDVSTPLALAAGATDGTFA